MAASDGAEGDLPQGRQRWRQAASGQSEARAIEEQQQEHGDEE